MSRDDDPANRNDVTSGHDDNGHGYDPSERRANDPSRPLRVVLCPVNTAGVPWTMAQALRGRGIDAKLVVFERYALHPEADVSLDRTGGIVVDREIIASGVTFKPVAPAGRVKTVREQVPVSAGDGDARPPHALRQCERPA